MNNITVGELKKAIADLPDDLPVYVNSNPKDSNDAYYISSVKLSKKSSISNEYVGLNLGQGFGW